MPPRVPALLPILSAAPCTLSSASNSLYLGTAAAEASRMRCVPLVKVLVPRVGRPCRRTSCRMGASYEAGPGAPSLAPRPRAARRGPRKRSPEQPKAPCREATRLVTSVYRLVSASLSYAPGPGAASTAVRVFVCRADSCLLTYAPRCCRAGQGCVCVTHTVSSSRGGTWEVEKAEHAGSASGCRPKVVAAEYAPGPGDAIQDGAERSLAASTS